MNKLSFRGNEMRQCLLVLLMFFLSANSYAAEQYKKFGQGKLVFVERNLTIDVEVATTKMQRTTGLMFREQLGINSGMLFDFEQEAIQRVWMRNTLIPLDVIFISEKGVVVSILKNRLPCTKEPCVIYESIKKARYMLEINAGMTVRSKVDVGQEVLFLL